MAMKRRRRTRMNRLRRTVYRSSRGAALFFSRVGNAFAAMRPRGRALVLVAFAGLLTGLVLLIVPHGKPAASVKTQQAAAAMNNAAPLSSGTQILELPAAPTPPPEAASSSSAPAPTPEPSYYEGCEDSQGVTELQNRLMDLGYLDLDEPTEHFGPATKYAVQLFQRQHGLQQDGIAGAQTLDMINSPDAQPYTLLEGTSGTDVDNFQRQLKALGYLSKITGYYGTETIDAVKAFQKRNGLSADGKAGQQTFDMINSDKAKASPAVAQAARSKANINKMISTAQKQLGDKYILGNEGPNSFDCSGLVYYCLKEGGSNRRRLNAAGYSGVSDWTKVSYSQLKKGDLLFFYNNARSKVGHVGIYIGGGMMIDASSANGKVVRRSCTTSYWKSHFVCARRPW